jgi:transaldolase
LSAEGIKTNVTLNFSASQALVAAKVGATYISPFVGRLDEISQDGTELVQQIKTIYDNYGFTTKIIVAAARNPLHVLDAALIGADVTTMTFEIMENLFKHPLTDVGLEMFLDDWKKVPK